MSALEAWLEGANESQMAALSLFHLVYDGTDEFSFQRIDRMVDMVVIFGKFGDEDAAFLPLSHDYYVSSDVVPSFIDFAGDCKKYLALCASDSSIKLYEVSSFSFENIHTEALLQRRNN